jgi:hypothetical protein
MRGFLSLQVDRIDGAPGAAGLCRRLRKASPQVFRMARRTCAMVASDIGAMAGGRPTLVQLDRHHPATSRAGLRGLSSGVCARVESISGSGHDLSGDGGAQSSAFGRPIVQPEQSAPLWRTDPVARAKDLSAINRHLPVDIKWNKMPAMNALFVMVTDPAAGSAERHA